MGKISIGRVLLGGVVAGLVGDGLGYLVDGIWLAPLWSDGMLSLGKNEFSPDQWIYFNVLGLVTGIVAVWIYAAIRPRLGPGPLTAASAGAAVWVVGSLVPNLSFMWFGGLFGHRLTAFTTAAALVEIVAGTIAGAALYKE
jgi:hypothetical protein